MVDWKIYNQVTPAAARSRRLMAAGSFQWKEEKADPIVTRRRVKAERSESGERKKNELPGLIAL